LFFEKIIERFMYAKVPVVSGKASKAVVSYGELFESRAFDEDFRKWNVAPWRRAEPEQKVWEEDVEKIFRINPLPSLSRKYRNYLPRVEREERELRRRDGRGALSSNPSNEFNGW
jgi:hypothetical protein